MTAFIQIPNLPPATALNGLEQLEAVQQGTSVRLTVQQIAQFAADAAITDVGFVRAANFALLSRDYQAVFITGGQTIGDGASGWVILDPTSNATVDNAMVFPTFSGIGRYLRPDDGVICAAWWYQIDWSGDDSDPAQCLINTEQFTQFLIAVDNSPLHIGFLQAGTINFGGNPVYWTSDGTSSGNRISACSLHGCGMQNASTLEWLQFHINNLPPELSGHPGFGSSGSFTLADLTIAGSTYLWNTDRANFDRVTFEAPPRALTLGLGKVGPGSAVLNMFNVTHPFLGRVDVKNGAGEDEVTGEPLLMHGIRVSNAADTFSWLHGTLSENMWGILGEPFDEIPSGPTPNTGVTNVMDIDHLHSEGNVLGIAWFKDGCAARFFGGHYRMGENSWGGFATSRTSITIPSLVTGATCTLGTINDGGSGAGNIFTPGGSQTGTFAIGQVLHGDNLTFGTTKILSSGGGGTWIVSTIQLAAAGAITAVVPQNVTLTTDTGLSISTATCTTGTISDGAGGAGRIFVPSGTLTGGFSRGQALSGTGVTAGTTITDPGPSQGSWYVSVSQNVSATTITGSPLTAGARIFVARFVLNNFAIRGALVSYNSGTGEMVVAVDETVGTGTRSTWNVGDASCSTTPVFKFGDSVLSESFDTVVIETDVLGPNNNLGTVCLFDKATGPLTLRESRFVEFSIGAVMNTSSSGLDFPSQFNRLTLDQQFLLLGSGGQLATAPVPTTTLDSNTSYIFDGSRGSTQIVVLNGANVFGAPTNLQPGVLYTLYINKTANGDSVSSYNSRWNNIGDEGTPSFLNMTTTQKGAILFNVQSTSGANLQVIKIDNPGGTFHRVELANNGTYTFDGARGNVQRVRLRGANTFGAPTNLRPGQTYTIYVTKLADADTVASYNAAWQNIATFGTPTFAAQLAATEGSIIQLAVGLGIANTNPPTAVQVTNVTGPFAFP